MTWQKKLQEMYRERHLLGLNIKCHPVEVMRPWLNQNGFCRAIDLRQMQAQQYVKLAGEVVIVHTPPQRDGTRVFFTTMEDETGLIDLVLFPRNQKGNSRVMLAHPLLLIWGKLNRRGEKDNLVVVNRVAPAPVRLPQKAIAAPRGE